MELGELEERYWHDFNDFQIQLRAHVDERDVLLRKVRGEPSRIPAYCISQRAVAMLGGLIGHALGMVNGLGISVAVGLPNPAICGVPCSGVS